MEKIPANQELRSAAFFQAHGYLVRRGLKVSLDNSPLDATDVDVYCIRFSNPCWEETLIVDCKDKKKPKPFERVLWTAGLRQATNATRGVIVLPHPPWQAYSFATKNGLEVLKADSILDFLESKPNHTCFGSADPELWKIEGRTRNQLNESDRDLIRKNVKLQTLLLDGHPLTNFNQIVNILTELGSRRASNSADYKWYYRFVCFNAAVIASVMLLRFVSEIKWLPEKDWTEYAKKKLTYGDMPPKKAVELVKIAYKTQFHDGLPAPSYTDEVFALLEALMNSSNSIHVPYFLEYDLAGHKLCGSRSNLMDEKLVKAQDLAKLIKRLISVLSYAAEFEPSFWEREFDVESLKSSGVRISAYDPQKDYSKHVEESPTQAKESKAAESLPSPTDEKQQSQHSKKQSESEEENIETSNELQSEDAQSSINDFQNEDSSDTKSSAKSEKTASNGKQKVN